MSLSQFPLNFLQIQKGLLFLISQLMTILVWIEMVFVTIFETFHGMISLNLVVLQLLLNFMSVSWFELMYISLIINIR